jgi:short-subunit dehydrogenase
VTAGNESAGVFGRAPVESQRGWKPQRSVPWPWSPALRSTLHLAKYVVRDMVARGEGRILFTSSIASTMPGSFQAVYNASKSFVQSLALALREELKDTGVTVTSLMPDRLKAAMHRHMAEPGSDQ